MHKVDFLTDLPKLWFVNKKCVEWLKIEFYNYKITLESCNKQMKIRS